MTTPDIQILPYKRSQYDRASRKIVVDGVLWGYLYAESHGMHGYSYHAHDLHGTVGTEERKIGPHKGERIEARFHPKGAKSFRYDNIGKPKDQKIKPKSTDEQLREHVAELIANGYLRAPDVRKKEIEEAWRRYRESRERREKEEAEALRARAVEVVETIQRGACGEVAIGLIVQAMKWAQMQ